MATITYNGMELEEFTSDKPVIFDKPRAAICWMNNGWHGGVCAYVIAFIPRSDSCLAVTDHSAWLHCALLPEKPSPRRATNRELAKWLAKGNGEWANCKCDTSSSSDYLYEFNHSEDTLIEDIRVRKWDDTEWREPTVDYLGIGEEG